MCPFGVTQRLPLLERTKQTRPSRIGITDAWRMELMRVAIVAHLIWKKGSAFLPDK
jgi:hypothetical protein